jgi:hypothetical protein
MALADAIKWLDKQAGDPDTGFVTTTDIKQAFTQTYTDIGTGGGGGGVTDHGALTGLADDDHTQYLTTTRHSNINHSGIPGVLDQTTADARYITTATGDTRYVNAGGDAMTGNLDMGANSIRTAWEVQAAVLSGFTGSYSDRVTTEDPIEPANVATKNYVDTRDTAVVAAHEAASDPHPVYLTTAEHAAINHTGIPGIGSGGGGGSSMYTNVLDYGAVPGTNCTTALNSAITAAGVGGTIFLPNHPSGDSYYIDQSIQLLSGQRLVGTLAPGYNWDHLPNLTCAIEAAAGFSDNALITRENGAVDVQISNVAFIGLGETGTIDGIDFGPVSGGGGERAWTIRDCYFNGLHTALSGHMWVVRVKGCHFTRCGYGVRPSSGNDTSSAMNDSRFDDCDFYFTYNHAVCFDSTIEAGMSNFSNCRFERSGVTPGSPNVNRNQSANGVRITNGHALQFVNCQTDGNAGPGLYMDGTGSGRVHAIRTSNCIWKRDGTGNNASSLLPGVYIAGTDLCSSSNDVVTWGDPDDAGSGYLSPQYGVQFAGSNNQYVWIGEVEVPSSGATRAYYYTGSNNYQCPVLDPKRGRHDIVALSDSNAPQTPVTGTTYFSTTQGALRSWNGTAWVTGGSGGGGSVDSVNGSTGTVVLDAADVGADPAGSAAAALASAQTYTDSKMIVLGPTDPVPGGTAVDTVIVRKAV